MGDYPTSEQKRAPSLGWGEIASGNHHWSRDAVEYLIAAWPMLRSLSLYHLADLTKAAGGTRKGPQAGMRPGGCRPMVQAGDNGPRPANWPQPKASRREA
jgi:hypothetical protein